MKKSEQQALKKTQSCVVLSLCLMNVLFFFSNLMYLYHSVPQPPPPPRPLSRSLLWSPLIKHLGSQRLCAIMTRVVLIFTCWFVPVQSVRNCLVVAVCYGGQYSPFYFDQSPFVLSCINYVPPPKQKKKENPFCTSWMLMGDQGSCFFHFLDNPCQCWRRTLRNVKYDSFSLPNISY